MKLAIIVPVGPGHRRISRRCELTTRYAIDHGKSIDRDLHVETCFVDDTQGLFGRAAARNHGMAVYDDADWYFFVDADDMMHVRSIEHFLTASKADPTLKGIWGAGRVVLRETLAEATGEIQNMTWDHVIHYRNKGTFGMGQYVAGPEARELRFDESVPLCEGYEFCMSFISSYPWKKIDQPLAVVDRDQAPSSDHRNSIRSDWTRAFSNHTLKWKERGRRPLTEEELGRRHRAEKQRLTRAWALPEEIRL